MRVLIVDDSMKVRAELRQILNRLGIDVIGEATNGIEALRLIGELSPDLVTLDIIMPEMDGIECYRLMRTLKNPPRCIIISMLASEPRVIQAFRHEIFSSHFMKKPVTEKELREKIEEITKLAPLPWPEKPEGELDDQPSPPSIEA